MAFTEDEAKAFLMDLVKKPEFPAGEIAGTYREVVTFHNEMFPAEDPREFGKKKRRRTSQMIGWPAGAAKPYTDTIEVTEAQITIDPAPVA